MTDAEAGRIEEEFSIRIPSAWRSYITDCGWCERFAASGLLTDYDDMRRENRLYRDSQFVRNYWRPEWLAIHSDGCGNVYFLDTLNPVGIFELDHEKTFPGYNPLEREIFPSIHAFLAHVEEHELHH
jgi:cell wall assembly regulator SMI1